MKVNINVASVFAQIATADELKAVANDIVVQVKNQYTARLSEILGTNVEQPVSVSVNANEVPATDKAAKGKGRAKSGKKTAAKSTDTKSADAKKAEETPAEETPAKKAREVVEQVSIGSLTKAQIKKMGIQFEQYSEKCMFLTGDTRCIKDEIMANGGAHWNSSRKGWFIKNDNAKDLAKALKIKVG